MYIYKELKLYGDKSALDKFSENIYSFFSDDWKKPIFNNIMRNYIVADYVGDRVSHAEVSIYYGPETWKDGYIKVVNIVPLEKNQLTVAEYNDVLDLFFEDIIVSYCAKNNDIRVEGPTSDVFKPLDYISESALAKLEKFCNFANKSTGSSHPSDEERWYDFICQTVDDERVFDYDTLFKFLCDEEYWGRKGDEFIGVIGKFAWSEDMASELALEYDNSVRLLQFYNKRSGER